MRLVVLGKPFLVQGPPQPLAQASFKFGQFSIILDGFPFQDGCAHGIAMGEQFLVFYPMVECPVAPHGEPGTGPGTSICLDPELLFDFGQELLMKEILPGYGTVVSVDIKGIREAVRHDDDDGRGSSLSYGPIGYLAGLALDRPIGMVPGHSVK